MKLFIWKIAIFTTVLLLGSTSIAKEVTLLNVSYDPTRELYREFNTAPYTSTIVFLVRKGNTDVANAYLNYLYTKEGQEIAAKNFYRPRDPQVGKAYASSFPAIEFTTITDFGGWSKAQPLHFGDGGIFDKIYEAPRS